MSWFTRRSKRVLDDPDFGRITEREPGSWEGQEFQLWGHSQIQVLIDGAPEGPNEEQRVF